MIGEDGRRTEEIFYALHGGSLEGDPFKATDLPLIGWVPKAHMYIIRSTGTEIRLVHELQGALKPSFRSKRELSGALYASRLRAAVVAWIPADNRRASRPDIVSPHCHAFTCWLARAACHVSHSIIGRKDWMDAYHGQSLEMWQTLARASGKGNRST